ncbi:Sugar/inositol transporter [Lasiodiplodia theobromae]|uniref:Sugar/inositol transporter n=1 Tax=Lasiodiplodia theobromae TaxID=45133 RepID=UPI0015C2E1DE|nr:Sugar/inositol transporter [Lasiodiplodia theobromae]KAF4537525.1 Sugar/inositol transporter [Lasiodiplodia theobromae]KAF9639507.1 Sugar/inositol transporter [Lasiodiplodia theobromae]
MSYLLSQIRSLSRSKQAQVVLFSSTAIALYGYDQGMMSLINTNHDYLSRMRISGDSPLVGIIVSVYYLGCSVGAVFFSWFADQFGRKPAIFFCLATASLGNFIMFIAGLGGMRKALEVMFLGRVIMGLGVGGIDSVIPVYSAELAETKMRGRAMGQEFQMNIFGLNMAFAINLGVTVALGKDNQWAWRIPIIVMQAYPILLLACIELLPESPRFYIYHGREEDAKKACEDIDPRNGKETFEELKESHEREADKEVTYLNMLTPGHPQFHPTIVTIMGQINQALTGYGAVSVYGPQIFELLGFDVRDAEYLTMGNYVSYFFLMTFAWLLIDAVGRRKLLLGGSVVLTSCFVLLAIFGGLSMNSQGKSASLDVPTVAFSVPGIVTLYVATGAFGIGWLATVWLIPTEIYPTTARAQAAAISVVIWGLANFTITLLTPIMFNNLRYWLFLVFAASNAIAGLWTWAYLPESGGRSFEENQRFFDDAVKDGTWQVRKIENGAYLRMPYPHSGEAERGERAPLLQRVREQIP